jgi:hypothetical protein
MELIEFAFALRETLEKINAQSFNNFILRIGTISKLNLRGTFSVNHR